MNIITNFFSKESLNTYLDNSLKNELIIKIDSVEKYYCVADIDAHYLKLRSLALNELTLEDFNNLCTSEMNSANSLQLNKDRYESFKDITLYVYPLSKTMYRKSIHARLPDSLYKRLYTCLKEREYITAATGNYVLIAHGHLNDEDFQSILETSSIDIKALQSAISFLQENNNDNAYYISYIKTLESKVQELELQINNLKTQIVNSSLTTWY